jgi:hypothetical protein
MLVYQSTLTEPPESIESVFYLPYSGRCRQESCAASDCLLTTQLRALPDLVILHVKDVGFAKTSVVSGCSCFVMLSINWLAYLCIRHLGHVLFGMCLATSASTE